jgi:hypothetical protein
MQRSASEGVRGVGRGGRCGLVRTGIGRAFSTVVRQRMGKRRGYAGVEPAPRRTVHKKASVTAPDPYATGVFARGRTPAPQW